jgi:hypothetical protein
MQSEQVPRLSESDRSLAYSILKIEYGWNGCTDRAEKQETIELLIVNSDCPSCAADKAAQFIAVSQGFEVFRQRADGKPNTRIVKPFIVSSGNLVRSPAAPLSEVGQEGNQSIHECRNTPDCLCLKCFEKLAQGGNQ